MTTPADLDNLLSDDSEKQAPAVSVSPPPVTSPAGVQTSCAAMGEENSTAKAEGDDSSAEVSNNPPITIVKTGTARIPRVFSTGWTKDRKTFLVKLIAANVKKEDFGDLVLEYTEYDKLREYVPGNVISWWFGHSPNYRHEHFKPTNVLPIDIDGIVTDAKTLDDPNYSPELPVEVAERAFRKAYPDECPEVLIRPSRSGQGAHCYILADRLFADDNEWREALAYISAKLRDANADLKEEIPAIEFDASPNYQRIIAGGNDADEIKRTIEGGFVTLPSREELIVNQPNRRMDKEIKSSRPMQTRSGGQVDFTDPKMVKRATAANRWISQQLKEIESGIQCYQEGGRYPAIIRLTYTGQGSGLTYKCIPGLSPRVTAFKTLIGEDGRVMDAWRDKCRSMNEEAAYELIEAILDTASSEHATDEVLNTETWDSGLLRRCQLNAVYEETQTQVKEDLSVGKFPPALVAFKRAFGFYPPYITAPFRREPDNKEMWGYLEGYANESGDGSEENGEIKRFGSDRGATLAAILLYKVDAGQLGCWKDTATRTYQFFGPNFSNTTSTETVLRYVKEMVQTQFTRFMRKSEKDVGMYPLKAEEIREMLGHIADKHDYVWARLKLLDCMRTYNETKDKGCPFRNFVVDGMNGCFEEDDEFVAKVIKVNMLYRTMRLYAPSLMGVDAFCNLLLKGSGKLGKSGLIRELGFGHKRGDKAKSFISAINSGEDSRLQEKLKGALSVELMEGLGNGSDDDKKSLLERKTATARPKFEKGVFDMPIQSMWDITQNMNVKLSGDAALLRRIVQFRPIGHNQPDGSPPKFNFDVVIPEVVRMYGACAELVAGFLQESFPETFYEESAIEEVFTFGDFIPGFEWGQREKGFTPFIHNKCDTLPEGDLTKWQISNYTAEDKAEICRVIPAHILNYVAFTKERRGLLIEKDVKNLLHALKAGKYNDMPEIPQQAFLAVDKEEVDAALHNYGNKVKSAATALLKGHGWEKCPTLETQCCGVRRKNAFWNSALLGVGTWAVTNERYIVPPKGSSAYDEQLTSEMTLQLTLMMLVEEPPIKVSMGGTGQG